MGVIIELEEMNSRDVGSMLGHDEWKISNYLAYLKMFLFFIFLLTIKTLLY
jgi:hypothetical protein